MIKKRILIAAAVLAAGCANNTTSPPAASPPPASKPAPTGQVTAKPAPTAPAVPAVHSAGPIRALYMSGYTAGTTARWNQLLDLVDKTELNAVVIDVKEAGEITYPSSVPLARAVGANRNWIPDIEARLAALKKRDIYPIARITCFRDKIVPKKRPDLAICSSWLRTAGMVRPTTPEGPSLPSA